MAISSSSSSSSSENKVQNCSKCLESFKCLQKNYDTEREKHNKAKLEIRGYEIALESLEARILGHEKNELTWGERYEFQNYDLKCREIKINNLNLEHEKVVKERDELKLKIEKWEGSSKNLTKILNSTTNEATIVKPKSVNEIVVSKSKINRDEVVIEDWTSDDEDDVSADKTISSIKPNVTQADKSGQPSQKQGIVLRKPKDLKPDVKTFGVNNMTTVGTRAVVIKGKVENVFKKDKWVCEAKDKLPGSWQSRDLVTRSCSYG
ncbi:hypothetical protein Tco_1441453 [Tanacetum coccineum]